MAERPRNRKPEGIGSLVPKILEELGLDQASQGAVLLREWDRVLGPTLAPHCRPEGVRKGVVHSLVRDSAWMQRLQMDQPRIIRGLKEVLGEDELRLRMRIGPMEDD